MKLSDYERQRLETIRRNQQILEALMIPSIKASIVAEEEALAKSRKRPAPLRQASSEHTPMPTRRSTRLVEQKTGVKLLEPGKPKELSEEETRALEEARERERKARPFRALLGSIPFSPKTEPDEGLRKVFETSKIAAALIRTKASTDFVLEKPQCVCKVMPSRIYSLAALDSTSTVLFAAGGREGQISLWNCTSEYNQSKLSNGDNEALPQVWMLYAHTPSERGSVSSLNFLGHKLLSTSYDGAVKLFDPAKASKDCFTVVGHALNRELVYSASTTSGDESTVWISCGDGFVQMVDAREASSSNTTNRHQLHETKIGTVSVCEKLLLTASNDRSVGWWDLRKLSPKHRIAQFETGRAATSAFLHPRTSGLALVTSYDDTVRLVDSDGTLISTFEHNNQTGRWITPFRAVWDPQSGASEGEYSRFAVGNMGRALDLYTATTGHYSKSTFESALLTSQPAVNCFHPRNSGIIASGNASGRIILWTST